MWQARIRDGWQMLRQLSFRRVLNMWRVFASYYYSRITGRPDHWGLPISVSVEPTTSCNLRCPECPSGLRAFSRPTGMLDMNTFSSIIDQIAPTTPYLTLYFQGEPYLNKNFFDMVAYASSRRMYVATSTNGHYLTPERARKTVESGLSRLIISIDGTDQETYTQYRIGGKLEKVLAGAREIVKWKRELKSATPHIIFQFLVVKPNEHQIPEVYRLAKEIGVDEVKLKSAQVYEYENGNPLIPESERYSRYKKQPDGTYTLKHKLLNHCWKMWQGCVFTWDAKVVPCCFDKDATHQMGDLSNQTFKELWQGEKYRNFRKALLKGRSQIDICQNCTEGAEVWV